MAGLSSDQKIARTLLAMSYILLVGSVAFLAWYIDRETGQIDEEICAQLSLHSEFDEQLFPGDPTAQAVYRERVNSEYNRVCAR